MSNCICPIQFKSKSIYKKCSPMHFFSHEIPSVPKMFQVFVIATKCCVSNQVLREPHKREIRADHNLFRFLQLLCDQMGSMPEKARICAKKNINDFAWKTLKYVVFLSVLIAVNCPRKIEPRIVVGP